MKELLSSWNANIIIKSVDIIPLCWTIGANILYGKLARRYHVFRPIAEGKVLAPQ